MTVKINAQKDGILSKETIYVAEQNLHFIVTKTNDFGVAVNFCDENGVPILKTNLSFTSGYEEKSLLYSIFVGEPIEYSPELGTK